jgi:hypothetical protein
VALRKAVDEMVAASKQLHDTGEEGLTKLVTVFGDSMVTLCSIWDQCATLIEAKYFEGRLPQYHFLCYVHNLKHHLSILQLHQACELPKPASEGFVSYGLCVAPCH